MRNLLKYFISARRVNTESQLVDHPPSPSFEQQSLSAFKFNDFFFQGGFLFLSCLFSQTSSAS